MGDFLLNNYLWIKAFHIISVISWMAGMFYLPRLFVYHSQSAPGSDMSNQFLVMERRLIKIIINPAMILTFVFGFMLLFTPGAIDFSNGWVHAKLLLVFVMAGFHGIGVRWYKAFLNEERNISHRVFRVANEIPVIIMVVIVILVVVRPF